MRKDKVAESVDEYIAALPSTERVVLERVRAAIKAAAPKAEEVISYQIPTYRFEGPLVHFAHQRKHLSFYGVSPTIFKTFKKQLKSFSVVGRTIHFTPDRPLPVTLVRNIVKARLAENIAHAEKERKAALAIKEAAKRGLKEKVCSRGHRFTKSPCQKCYPGFYKKTS
ncbi:MAG: DUF1801 domain-containing protein [Candidatus Pacebacteria bacterium]|nr:DUF1801 domain-containing protein [Candidatus Paceibacterota bacterium]